MGLWRKMERVRVVGAVDAMSLCSICSIHRVVRKGLTEKSDI